MAYGYQLAATAASASADFIPSLIGVKADQHVPGARDVYFEQQELTRYTPGCITSVEKTNLVCYDSVPAPFRDPILACKAAGFGFYIPVSEAIELARDEGDGLLLQMVQRLFPKSAPLVA